MFNVRNIFKVNSYFYCYSVLVVCAVLAWLIREKKTIYFAIVSCCTISGKQNRYLFASTFQQQIKQCETTDKTTLSIKTKVRQSFFSQSVHKNNIHYIYQRHNIVYTNEWFPFMVNKKYEDSSATINSQITVFRRLKRLSRGTVKRLIFSK